MDGLEHTTLVKTKHRNAGRGGGREGGGEGANEEGRGRERQETYFCQEI